MSEDNVLRDESQDQKYFTVTPRLVWAMSRNPYDFVLWTVVKSIAGESGECYLSTEDLATLAMMSTGQASESRAYWLRTGLLVGELRRDPDYPQPVWHLRVPNIWRRNVDWSEKYPGLKERIEFKRAQMAQIRAERKTLNQDESLHQVKPSPGEGGVTPGEGGVTPGETKNNHKKIKKKKGGGVEKRTPDILDGMIAFGQIGNAGDFAALTEFESALGFGKLPWGSNSTWERFRKFVIRLHGQNPDIFRGYARWREGEGKYRAFSNRKIRENPSAFMDTGYPEYEAHCRIRQDRDPGGSEGLPESALRTMERLRELGIYPVDVEE